MSTPKAPVSLGLPVYNGGKFLRETIESILEQTYQDFELVISDNASTDETEEVCRTFAKTDGRIVYCRQPQNRGAAWNYNEVFRLASGRYFKWCACDDLLAPTLIERCVSVLNAQSDMVLAYPRTAIIDAKSSIVKEYDDRLHLVDRNAVSRFCSVQALLGECNAVFGLIRSEALAKTALIGSYIASDVHLLMELSLYGGFWQVQERLFFRRDHPQASSSQLNRSVEAQMQFFDPLKTRRFVFPLWRAMRADFRAVVRAPLTVSERATLCAVLLRSAIWSRAALMDELVQASWPPRR